MTAFIFRSEVFLKKKFCKYKLVFWEGDGGGLRSSSRYWHWWRVTENIECQIFEFTWQSEKIKNNILSFLILITNTHFLISHSQRPLVKKKPVFLTFLGKNEQKRCLIFVSLIFYKHIKPLLVKNKTHKAFGKK